MTGNFKVGLLAMSSYAQNTLREECQASPTKPIDTELASGGYCGGGIGPRTTQVEDKVTSGRR